jgi:hypothetical protein
MEPVTEKQARELDFLNRRFVPYEDGFTDYDWGVVFYVINRGQSGIHKVCSLHLTLDEAKAALEKFDPVLRPHTEIRAGMMIEGPPIKLEKPRHPRKPVKTRPGQARRRQDQARSALKCGLGKGD